MVDVEGVDHPNPQTLPTLLLTPVYSLCEQSLFFCDRLVSQPYLHNPVLNDDIVLYAHKTSFSSQQETGKATRFLSIQSSWVVCLSPLPNHVTTRTNNTDLRCR